MPERVVELSCKGARDLGFWEEKILAGGAVSAVSARVLWGSQV